MVYENTLRTLAVAMTVAALASACSSTSSSTPGAPATPPAASQSRAGFGSPAGSSPVACRTSGLRITLDSSQADGAAGSTYYPLDFTNTAAAACVLDGYPGVSFVTAADKGGAQIGAAATRNQQFGLVRVKLEPGAEAHAWLQVGTPGNYPASTCQPVTARGLRVYPPGETEAGYLRQDVPACAGGGAQLLTIMPVRDGKAIEGTAP
ncbi:MAG TPA: DUF4232 domain-containing protein [Streptosporangiaceae bacterium]